MQPNSNLSGITNPTLNELRDKLTTTLTQLIEYDDPVLAALHIADKGSTAELEVMVAVVGRLLTQGVNANPSIILHILEAVLSHNIPINSPARISTLILPPYVKEWDTYLVNGLDRFLAVSLGKGNTLIQEQALDFISTHCEWYGKLPHHPHSIRVLKELTRIVLRKVDEPDIYEEWEEGINTFIAIAEHNAHPHNVAIG